MFPDPWLSRWLPLLMTRSQGMSVLEIGCGHGDDTAMLAGAGLQVIAFDLLAILVRIGKTRVPSAQIERRDTRAPFPASARDVGVVLASLSLHYVGWDDTVNIVRHIRAVLRPDGVLLCGVNSTEDSNFGATGYEQLKPDYFLVKGELKRFLDEKSARAQSLTAGSLNYR